VKGGSRTGTKGGSRQAMRAVDRTVVVRAAEAKMRRGPLKDVSFPILRHPL
jgi:hypothetical protein